MINKLFFLWIYISVIGEGIILKGKNIQFARNQYKTKSLFNSKVPN